MGAVLSREDSLWVQFCQESIPYGCSFVKRLFLMGAVFQGTIPNGENM